MKIIENNNKQIDCENVATYEIVFPIKERCDSCNSLLSIDEDDLHIGWSGANFFTCPCCGEESMCDQVDGINLTIENLEFPTHFHHTNKNLLNVKEISVGDVSKSIKELVLHLRNNKDELSYTRKFGDAVIHVCRYDSEELYEVIVSKDFYQTEIPFEASDYKEITNEY